MMKKLLYMLTTTVRRSIFNVTWKRRDTVLWRNVGRGQWETDSRPCVKLWTTWELSNI
jgi:hypothetical protein